MRIATLMLIATLIAHVGCATADSPAPANEPSAARTPSGDFAGLADAIAHERRDDDRARDVYRHPEETLRFFDVQPTHTVVEYAPGGGWYTRVIAPYVADEGQYVAVVFAGDDTPIERLQKGLVGWDEGFPGRVEEMAGVPAAKTRAYFGSAIPEEAHGTVDRVVIPRMLHNLKRWDIADQELRAIRTMLKDDGLVGVVQHRAKPDAPYSYADGNKGYLREADVVAMMELSGFRLVDRSEINANPKDTADYEGGVWTLPPSLRLGDVDREKYVAIGESDRATLLFEKAD